MTGAPPAGIPDPTAPAPAQRPRRLPRRWRNLLLTVHIVVAVGALGTDTILLTLGVTGLVSGDGELPVVAGVQVDGEGSRQRADRSVATVAAASRVAASSPSSADVQERARPGRRPALGRIIGLSVHEDTQKLAGMLAACTPPACPRRARHHPGPWHPHRPDNPGSSPAPVTADDATLPSCGAWRIRWAWIGSHCCRRRLCRRLLRRRNVQLCQQNTNTGRLTEAMLDAVFWRSRELFEDGLAHAPR